MCHKGSTPESIDPGDITSRSTPLLRTGHRRTALEIPRQHCYLPRRTETFCRGPTRDRYCSGQTEHTRSAGHIPLAVSERPGNMRGARHPKKSHLQRSVSVGLAIQTRHVHRCFTVDSMRDQCTGSNSTGSAEQHPSVSAALFLLFSPISVLVGVPVSGAGHGWPRLHVSRRLPLRAAGGRVVVEPSLVVLVPLRRPAGRHRRHIVRRRVDRSTGRPWLRRWIEVALAFGGRLLAVSPPFLRHVPCSMGQAGTVPTLRTGICRVFAVVVFIFSPFPPSRTHFLASKVLRRVRMVGHSNLSLRWSLVVWYEWTQNAGSGSYVTHRSWARHFICLARFTDLTAIC